MSTCNKGAFLNKQCGTCALTLLNVSCGSRRAVEMLCGLMDGHSEKKHWSIKKARGSRSRCLCPAAESTAPLSCLPLLLSNGGAWPFPFPPALIGRGHCLGMASNYLNSTLSPVDLKESVFSGSKQDGQVF